MSAPPNPWAHLVGAGPVPPPVPVRLPSMAPITRQLLAMLQEQLGNQLPLVAAELGTPGALEAPREWHRASITDVRLFQQFPALVIDGWNLRAVAASEQQPGVIGWNGSCEIVWWVRNDDPDELQEQLDAYQGALYTCVLGNEPDMAYGAQIIAESLLMEQSEPLATANLRGVHLAFDVWFTTG